jgi:hypothetical protein
MLHKGYYRKGSVGKRTLVVGLKGLEATTNLMVVNRQSQSDFALDFPELLVSFHASLKGYRDAQVCPSVCPSTISSRKSLGTF